MSMSVETWCFLIFIALLLIFSVTSNTLVLIVILKNNKLRNVTNILICNLALSDILLAGFTLPQNLHDLSHEENYHEGIVLCKIANACPIWCITCSIYSLIVISYERKRSIVQSMSKQISVKHCKIILPLLWTFSTLVATPTLVEFGEIEIHNADDNTTYTSCGAFLISNTFTLANGIILLFVSYIIPLIVIWYNYFKIIRFVWKKSNEINPIQQPGLASSSVILKRRVQIVKMLIVVAVLFAISWLPYFVSLVIAKVSGQDRSENATSSVNLLKIFLAAFSTAYNVIVYVMFNTNFRNGLKQLLCCCSKKHNLVIEATVIPTHSTARGNSKTRSN